MVCQWEFVSTVNGEILYERGLDRDGKVKFGLIYSPRELGPEEETRLARYVGPDGFPQFQRGSAAEYVMIRYDKEGWEDRITYHDGKSLRRSVLTALLARALATILAAKSRKCSRWTRTEHNMIDNAGNCGMEQQYDESGQLEEAKSVGAE